MNVTSAICSHAPGAEVSLSDGSVRVAGYAWSGGGRAVARVDVSADGGRTWAPAELSAPADNKPGRAWAASLYSIELPLPAGVKAGDTLELAVKATDEAYNTQPATPGEVWNVRGLMNNSWHRVAVKVVE
jgi:sulfite oxidase